MLDREQLTPIFRNHGFDDYKWIDPQRDVIVAQWVRFRCLFGCDSYGTFGSCPPAVPAVDECRKMIGEYNSGVILHFPMNEEDLADYRKQSRRLYALEREIFLAGFYKTFLLAFCPCFYCPECTAEGTREKCRNKKMSRPCAEAMGIDIYQTARNAGYPIQVIKNHGDPFNRYAFLLIH